MTLWCIFLIFSPEDLLDLLYIVLKKKAKQLLVKTKLYQFEPLNCGKLTRGLFSVA